MDPNAREAFIQDIAEEYEEIREEYYDSLKVRIIAFCGHHPVKGDLYFSSILSSIHSLVLLNDNIRLCYKIIFVYDRNTSTSAWSMPGRRLSGLTGTATYLVSQYL